MRTMGGRSVRSAMAGARWRQGGTWAPARPAPSRKGQALKSAYAIEGREARVGSPPPTRRRMKSAPPQRRRSPLRGACPRATRPASRQREAAITCRGTSARQGRRLYLRSIENAGANLAAFLMFKAVQTTSSPAWSGIRRAPAALRGIRYRLRAEEGARTSSVMPSMLRNYYEPSTRYTLPLRPDKAAGPRALPAPLAPACPLPPLPALPLVAALPAGPRTHCRLSVPVAAAAAAVRPSGPRACVRACVRALPPRVRGRVRPLGRRGRLGQRRCRPRAGPGRAPAARVGPPPRHGPLARLADHAAADRGIGAGCRAPRCTAFWTLPCSRTSS